MSMESRFNCFKTKHNLDDSAMKELLSLFNDSFIELAHKLLSPSVLKITPGIRDSIGGDDQSRTMTAKEAIRNQCASVKSSRKWRMKGPVACPSRP